MPADDPVLDSLTEHLRLPEDTGDFRVAPREVFEGSTAIAVYFGDCTALAWREDDLLCWVNDTGPHVLPDCERAPDYVLEAWAMRLFGRTSSQAQALRSGLLVRLSGRRVPGSGA